MDRKVIDRMRQAGFILTEDNPRKKHLLLIDYWKVYFKDSLELLRLHGIEPSCDPKLLEWMAKHDNHWSVATRIIEISRKNGDLTWDEWSNAIAYSPESARQIIQAFVKAGIL